MKVEEHGIGSTLGQEELEAIRRAVESGDSLSWGSERTAFEEDFKQYCGVKHAISVSSCTAALQIAAQVLRLGPDDEVVCTTQSFRATTIALVERGVQVRFADIDPATINVDPASVEAAITPKTKALYLVHHGGNPCDMDALRGICEPRGIPIVEDCAPAIGSAYQGAKIGDGDLCCFSFQSLKNMTTLGEGGMLTTNNDRWAEEASSLRSMGVLGQTVDRGTDRLGPYAKPDSPISDHAGISWTQDYTAIEEVGTHYRLSAVQAAVGRVQLRKIDDLNATRARVAQRYDDAIAGLPGLRRVKIRDGDHNAWHLYPCFLEPESGVDRDALIRHMQDMHGVQIILRFWPLHLSAEHRFQGHQFGECPVCENVWFEQQMNLPICPAMEDWEVEATIEALVDGMGVCKR